jgi:arabinofuranan 3-O-arabinosyltransferase
MASARWSNRVKASLVGIGVGLAFLMSFNWWNIYAHHVPKCITENCVADFVTFHAAAQLIWDDRQSLYDLDRQQAYQNRIAPVEKVLPFVYPPITAAFLAPLAEFDFSTAFLLMTLLNLLLIGQSLRWLIRGLNLSTDQSHWLLLFTLCNFGVQAVVFYGQTSAIVLFFLTLHVLAQRQAERPISGVWAGLLCIKPQYLGVPHLIMLVRHRWRECLVGVATATLLIIGLFLWIGFAASTQYLQLARRMVTADSDWWNQWRGMHNLRVLVLYGLPQAWHAAAWWILTTMVVGILIWINWRGANHNDDYAARWIVNCLGLLIGLPHLFTHDLTLLIVPCALLLSLVKPQVPPTLGIGLVALAILPAVNYLIPTIMAVALLILFTASLFLARGKFTLSQNQ